MQKPKSFGPWQPDQTTLLPQCEWLAEDHQVYFLLDLVDELDFSEILIPAQAKLKQLFARYPQLKRDAWAVGEHPVSPLIDLYAKETLG